MFEAMLVKILKPKEILWDNPKYINFKLNLKIWQYFKVYDTIKITNKGIRHVRRKSSKIN